MTIEALRQNNICSGSLLSMSSFAVEEVPSPLPALYATLPHQTYQTKTCSQANPALGHHHRNESFALKHSGQNACGIPEGQTIIMTGGGNSDGCHNFVTRWAISFNTYLIFVIFFTLAKFLENKIYTGKNA